MNAPARFDHPPRRLLHDNPSWSDEERRDAQRFNIDLVCQLGDAYRDFRDRLEKMLDDHSPPAIWRRAYRRSITGGRAERSRRWKARALNLDPAPLHNAIALSGMAPIQVDERWMIGVAIPQPAPLEDMGSRIEDVVLIDPDSGKAQLMGDHGCTHVAPPIGMISRLPVMTDAKAWGRHIALERLEWWRLKADRRRLSQAEPTWNGYPTAALLIADPKKVRWSDFHADILEVPADMRETVRRALLAQARLPRIEGRA